MAPVAATGPEWRCACGWRNRSENSVCGGVRRADTPMSKQYGCGAARPIPSMYGPYGGPETSHHVDGSYVYPRPVGNVAPTLTPLIGGEWTCSCGWKNRPQNVQCGGGRAGFGCGLDRATQSNVPLPGFADYPQPTIGYPQPYTDPQPPYPPAYPETTQGGPGCYPFVPGGYDPMSQQMHMYSPFWPGSTPPILQMPPQEQALAGSSEKRVTRPREGGGEWRCVCGWRNRADNGLCGGAKRAELTPGLKQYGCGAPRPLGSMVGDEVGGEQDEAGHALIGPTLKRAKHAS